MQLLTVSRKNRRQQTALTEKLTRREIAVLEAVATGQSNHEIADTLAIELGTVKWHLSNIYSKLAARNRIQAIISARRLKILG